MSDRFDLALPLDSKSLHDSPFQPRKHGDPKRLKELAASIKMRGISEPILVRPIENGKAAFEIVKGHRRRHAALDAGLTVGPAIIRKMTDEEVIECQLLELAQREDVHPMDEAEAYERLQKEYKHSVEDIAVKVGKSTAFIYGRLKLTALCPAARRAFYDGTLTASIALLVARIPDKALQEKALKDIIKPRYGDDAMTFREATTHVQQNFMLVLKDAPFDRADANLVPKAGACGPCPKRTGNQRELFADVSAKDDMCSDPTCYRAKCDALWVIRKAEAKAGGAKVIETKLFNSWGHFESKDFVQANTEATSGYRGVGKTWKAVAGKEVPVTLARDKSGGVIEVFPCAAVEPLAKKALKKSGSNAHLPSKADRDAQKRANEKAKAQAAARGHVVAACVAKIEQTGLNAKVLRFLVDKADRAYGSEEVITRRLPAPTPGTKIDPENEFKKIVAKMEVAQLVGLLFELTGDLHASYGGGLDEACELLGVDRKKVEAKAKEELDAAKAQAKVAAKAEAK